MSEDESVAIFWDYENCEIPGVADSFSITSGIRRIAHEYGNVKVFRAYMEVPDQHSPRAANLRSDIQACGVTMIDCPHNGRKDVADKMIMVDLLAHACDYPAPSTVVLISGDRDFTYAVSTLRLRKYRVVLLAPVAAHASLRAQASVVYEWPRSVLQAEPPVPTPVSTSRTRTPSSNAGRSTGPIPIDRSTPSMIRLYSSPSTPHSPTFPRLHAPLPGGERARSNSVQHGRSTSLPSNEISQSAPGPSTRPHYATAAAGPAAPPTDLSPTAGERLSPAWRSSRLFATAPVFQPRTPSTSSTPTVTVDAASRSQGSNYGEAPADLTVYAPSLPATPATTELSFDEDIATSSTYDGGYATDQQDRLSASSSAPHTPLDDLSFSPDPKAPAPVYPDGAPPPPPAVELRWAQVHPDVVVPTVVMTRLRRPPPKFKLLVRVLERERLAGNTRVHYSQLGSLLRQEHPAVYQRAGCQQLKEYVQIALDEHVVIVGSNLAEHGGWDNGNKWVALHPVYHGRIPEPQPQPYPPPPPMQPPSNNY